MRVLSAVWQQSLLCVADDSRPHCIPCCGCRASLSLGCCAPGVAVSYQHGSPAPLQPSAHGQQPAYYYDCDLTRGSVPNRTTLTTARRRAMPEECEELSSCRHMRGSTVIQPAARCQTMPMQRTHARYNRYAATLCCLNVVRHKSQQARPNCLHVDITIKLRFTHLHLPGNGWHDRACVWPC